MSDAVVRRARQSVRTSLLLGVEFVPRSHAAETSGTAAGGSRIVKNAPTESSSMSSVASASVSGTRAAKAAALAALHEEHDQTCPHCTTVEYINTVFGEGDPDADIMFVGEAPGAQEDETGRPFVGRAGQKLEEMIKAMGLSREDVFIANILKARPPNNRTPQADEVARCAPFLARQIAIIQPKAVVALGGPSSKFLLKTDIGITRLRGKWAVYESDGVRVDVMPTFHPAYLLRNYTRETRERVWSDLQAVLARVQTS